MCTTRSPPPPFPPNPKLSLRLETQSALQEFYFSSQGVETPLADTSSTLDKGEGGKRKRVLSNFLFYFAHTGP